MRPRQKLGLVSFVIISSLIIAVWFIFTPVSYAQSLAGAGEWLLELFSDLLFALAGLFIKLTFFSLKFIIEVAGYNGFIDSPAVIVGWVMVRDITNMFFVVVLLIISFGTILGLEQYEYKKLLVKLLMAAVIVNFSRLICGLIIDIAQVVMVTFVNGIAATASGNLVNMFQVDQIFKLAEGQTTKVGSTFEIFLAAVAAIVFATMMLVTMLTFLVLLLARMAMLWVLIVLSPFAFVLNVLPQTEKYASQWWEQFGGHVVAGPIIAFFLWLSFVTVGAGTAFDEIKKHNALPQSQTAASPEEEQTGITQIMSWAKMANFAIAIAMLLAGAKMAQQLGVVGGGLMGKAGDLGKKVAMYASGLQAARWTASNVLKPAAKYGLMKMPLGGEFWQRRGRSIKAWASYKTTKKGWLGLPSTESRLIAAGERIDKAYGKETQDIGKQSQEVQDLVAARDAALQSEDYHKADELGKKLKKAGFDVGEAEEGPREGLTELKKAYGGGTRAWARIGLALWTTSEFDKEYTNDKEARAKYAKEQMEHIVSTSKTPIGKEKTEAEQDLERAKETGGRIKKRKLADVAEKRSKIDKKIEADLAAGKSVEDVKNKYGERRYWDYTRLKNADKSAVQAEEITHAMAEDEKLRAAEARHAERGSVKGHLREEEAHTAKAKSKQIEEGLQAEKELEELKEIKKLLEGKGASQQAVINFTKAQTANIKEDFDISKEEAEVEQRAESFRQMGDDLRANQVLAEMQSKAAKREGDRVSAMSWEDKTFALQALPVKIQQLEQDIAAAYVGGNAEEATRLKEIKNKTVKRTMALQTSLKSEGKEAAELADSGALKAIGWNEVIDDANRIRAELSKILGKVVAVGDEAAAAEDVYRAFGGIEKAQGAMTLYSNANKTAGLKGAGSLFGLVGDRRNASGQLERFFGQYDQATNTVNAGRVKVGDGFYPTKIAEVDHRKWITANGYGKINVDNKIVGFDSQRAEQLAEVFNGKNDLFISQMQNGFFDSLNSAIIDRNNPANVAEYTNLLNKIKAVLKDPQAQARFLQRSEGLLTNLGLPAGQWP
ncbi:MAG: hypothetical protein HYT15_01530 [Candidatus Magasanikbacteria bacterium]|nr:hypothetical protein [Candidatus Magasanikbacteria bacterium]